MAKCPHTYFETPALEFHLVATAHKEDQEKQTICNLQHRDRMVCWQSCILPLAGPFNSQKKIMWEKQMFFGIIWLYLQEPWVSLSFCAEALALVLTRHKKPINGRVASLKVMVET